MQLIEATRLLTANLKEDSCLLTRFLFPVWEDVSCICPVPSAFCLSDATACCFISLEPMQSHLPEWQSSSIFENVGHAHYFGTNEESVILFLAQRNKICTK